MGLDEILVGEFGPVDGLSTGTITGGEVTSLTHEIRYDAVEDRAFVMERLATATESFLPGAECTEVIGGERSGVGVKFHDDTSDRFVSDGHVEEDFGIGVGDGVRHFGTSGELKVSYNLEKKKKMKAIELIVSEFIE